MFPLLYSFSQSPPHIIPKALCRILTPADKLLIILVLMIVLWLFIKRFAEVDSRGGTTVVEIAGQRAGAYSLEKAQILRFSGPLGVSEVEIDEGKVWVSKAPCRNKICINQGRIYQANSAIVCLPNQLVVRVVGGRRPFDGISQ
tara:strand:- start:171 stop:602 length:432 start_codon:yes stop_codon:yes gene_type:complete